MSNLGQKLREKREEKQLSIEELAGKIGISKYIIAQYEEEAREFSAYTLTKITDELEMDFWEVCADTDLMLTPEEPSEFTKQLIIETENYAKKMENDSIKWQAKIDLIWNSSKEEVLDSFLKGNKDLNLRETLDNIFQEPEIDFTTIEGWERYKIINERKEKLFMDIREAVLETINCKIKEVEKTYGNRELIKKKKFSNDNIIRMDFGKRDR